MMARLALILLILVFLPALAQAHDDGGFGSSFTNRAPSALTEAPNSTVAQTSLPPRTDAEKMQDILPAAGNEQANGAGQNQALVPPMLKPDTAPPKGEITK